MLFFLEQTNKESWTFSFGMEGVFFNLFVSSYLKKLLHMQVSYVPEEINGDEVLGSAVWQQV